MRALTNCSVEFPQLSFYKLKALSDVFFGLSEIHGHEHGADQLEDGLVHQQIQLPLDKRVFVELRQHLLLLSEERVYILKRQVSKHNNTHNVAPHI